MYSEEKSVLAVFAAIFGLLAFVILDMALAVPQTPAPAVVVSRGYEQARTHVGSGVALGANGQITTVVTSSHTPEKWAVVIRVNGKVVSAEVTPEQWADFQDGTAVFARCSLGRWSGKNYGWKIVSDR